MMIIVISHLFPTVQIGSIRRLVGTQTMLLLLHLDLRFHVLLGRRHSTSMKYAIIILIIYCGSNYCWHCRCYF